LERRKSGRGERKSLMDTARPDPVMLAAFYEDIDVDLTDGDRVSELLDNALEHGLRQLTAANFPKGIGKKDGKERLTAYYKGWREGSLKKQLRKTVKAQQLQPNPKNSEHARQATRFEKTRTRLTDELGIWKEWEQQNIGDSCKVVVDIAAPRSTSKKNSQPPDSLKIWEEDVGLAIDQLEGTVEACQNVAERGSQYTKQAEASISERSFKHYPSMDDPVELMRRATRGVPTASLQFGCACGRTFSSGKSLGGHRSGATGICKQPMPLIGGHKAL